MHAHKISLDWLNMIDRYDKLIDVKYEPNKREHDGYNLLIFSLSRT